MNTIPGIRALLGYRDRRVRATTRQGSRREGILIDVLCGAPIELDGLAKISFALPSSIVLDSGESIPLSTLAKLETI